MILPRSEAESRRKYEARGIEMEKIEETYKVRKLRR
jgi:hypothetical protein